MPAALPGAVPKAARNSLGVGVASRSCWIARMNEQLDYRDGHEQTDVAPVLVDRLAGGGVRVVVRYPHDVRVRARNRLFITVGVAIAWGLSGLWMAGGTRLSIVRAFIAGSF